MKRDAIWLYVLVGVEVQVCKFLHPIKIFSIRHLPMPQMKDSTWYVRHAPSYVVRDRSCPLKEMTKASPVVKERILITAAAKLPAESVSHDMIGRSSNQVLV